MTFKKLKDECAELSKKQRAKLACFLIGSLEDEAGDSKEAIAEAWRLEIRRRLDDIKAGRVKGIPADTVFAEMRKKYP